MLNHKRKRSRNMYKLMFGLVKKMFLVVFVFFIMMILFGENGSAYIDPSVMTYAIQAIAGVVIAVGAGVGIYWRKAKKKVQDKLGVEEKKEQESDDIF